MFHQTHLYSTLSESGALDPAMEQDLSVLESQASGVVQAILSAARSDRLPVLSDDQKATWYRFFLMQWRRTPETQQACTNDAQAQLMLDNTLNRLRLAAPHKLSEIASCDTPEARARILRNVRVQALDRLSEEVISVVENRGIAIVRITCKNKRFIIGSRPVVKLTMPGRTDLTDTSVEMWLPIASDVAVGVGRGPGDVSIYEANNMNTVRQMNEAIARQSGTIAAASEALVRSIANAVW